VTFSSDRFLEAGRGHPYEEEDGPRLAMFRCIQVAAEQLVTPAKPTRAVVRSARLARHGDQIRKGWTFPEPMLNEKAEPKGHSACVTDQVLSPTFTWPEVKELISEQDAAGLFHPDERWGTVVPVPRGAPRQRG